MRLRDDLVKLSLAWQDIYGVAPAITSAISEYDAAMLIGMKDEEYSSFMKDRTAVSRGYDFIYNKLRIPVMSATYSG